MVIIGMVAVVLVGVLIAFLFMQPSVPVNTIDDEVDCISREQLNGETGCLVAVNGIVYNMEGMDRWSRSSHFDCQCGGEYTIHMLPASHSQAKYYGSVVGKLCSN